MALSSKSLSKRVCPFSNASTTASGPSKRMCLGLGSDVTSFKSSVAFISSSEDNYDLDEQTCYNADQVKAKRRASARMSFSVNPSISRAVSKYSDEDEEEHSLNDEYFDCKLLSTSSSSINLGKLGKKSSMQFSDENNISNQNISSSPTKKYMSCDRNARSRCFDYLVASIDEAWARYCDLTSFAEDKVYGFEEQCAHTPASVATDEEDYFGNSTDLTDYDSEYEGNTKPSVRQEKRSENNKPKLSEQGDSTGNNPSSSQLQELKDRLTKAKYYLQDLVDSDDVNDVISFWKRWDMIKYATVELVEDDDDDDVVEGTIEELEEGRSFSF